VKIFVILPSLSFTEIAVYEGTEEFMREVIRHSPAEIYSLRTPAEQGRYRFDAIIERLGAIEYDLKDVEMTVTQVESDKLPPGIYWVEDDLLNFLSRDVIEENHLRSGVFAASLMSRHIEERFFREIIPLAVQPVIADEILQEAALSGIKGVTRSPQYKSLAQRAGIAFYAWLGLRKGMNDIRAVSVYLGNHISVGAFDMGRLADNNCLQDGEGPFSPASSGAIPLDTLIDLCYSGKYDMEEMLAMVSEKGGLSAYLEDHTLNYVSEQYRAGNRKVKFLIEAMAYSVAREIAAKAVTLRGNVEIIILVGPWVEFDEFVDLIKEQVEWISPVVSFEFSGELLTLSITAEKSFAGGYRILRYGRDRQEYR